MEISVIIPTYKPQDYLWECLNSLAKQTIGKDKYEIVIVLNGEYNPFCSQIQDYIDTYMKECTVYLLCSPITGVSNARNIGLKYSKGKYVCFIDDDDWVSENYLQDLFLNIEESTITTSYVVSCESLTGLKRCDYIGATYEKYANQPSIGILEGRRFLGSACCKMIPRTVIDSTLFDDRFSFGEDALFMAAISKRIRCLRTASNKPTYFRRINTESASRKRHSFFSLLREVLKLWSAYICVYFSAPFSYSTLFFANRMLAIPKGVFFPNLRVIAKS